MAPVDRTTHISVCVCTFRRPDSLRRLLIRLVALDSQGLFRYSIVISDNDRQQSAAPVAADFASGPVPIRYCVEPRQNIARARNNAVRNAGGEFVAFIDDDEFPEPDWLLKLFLAMREYDVAGVLGPVRSHFDAQPPRWLLDGGFFDRPDHPTGTRLDWNYCRTGNVLLKRDAMGSDPFRPECISGEDQDFFRRMVAEGHEFVWCNDALVHEVVPPVRWKRGYLAKRALFRGVFSLRNHGFPASRILQSLIAAPAYAAALPLALFFGQAAFMKGLFQFCYHTGRLLALAGVNPIGRTYLTE